MQTLSEENPARKALLADRGPRSATVNFERLSAEPEGDPAGQPVRYTETPHIAAEGDGHDDEDAVTPKLAARDGAGDADNAAIEPAVDELDETATLATNTETRGPSGADPSLANDTTGSCPDEAASAADDVSGGSAIFRPTHTSVMDLESFGVELDLDAYADTHPEASDEDDAALLARVQQLDEVIVDVVPERRVLDKRRTCRAAMKLGKKIKVRVHHGLKRELEKEVRYQLNEGGRKPIPEQTQKIRRARVLHLFWLRNGLGLHLTIEDIAQQTGYSKSWISKLEEEFLASNSSSGGQAEKRNLNRKKTPELVANAKAMFAAATPIDEIAKEMGVSQNTIRNWLKEGPETPQKNEPSTAEKGDIGTGPNTIPQLQSINASSVPTDLDLDDDDADSVDKALELVGDKADLKTAWQDAGRRLVAKRQEGCPGDGLEVLTAAVQACVEHKAANDAARKWLKQVLTAVKGGA